MVSVGLGKWGGKMTNLQLVSAYLDAWSQRDADVILATMGPGATYEDPSTGGPINADAFRAYTAALWGAFPDLSFEIVSTAETGPDSAAAQWIMRGTNTGSMRGLPPTGRPVLLPGADFFTFAGGMIATVTGYFDGSAIPRQLGLNILVQPFEAGPFRFGNSIAVSTGKRDVPGAFSITCLEALDEAAAETVREGSRASVIDMMSQEGFIGATMARIGQRMVTISAWTDAEAPRRVMAEGTHSRVQRGLMDGSLASAGYTSVWTLDRDNGFWMRCDACGKMSRKVSDGDVCACGQELPLHPPYW